MHRADIRAPSGTRCAMRAHRDSTLRREHRYASRALLASRMTTTTHPHLVWPVRMGSIRRLARTATARCLLPWWAASTVLLDTRTTTGRPRHARFARQDSMRPWRRRHARRVQRVGSIMTRRTTLSTGTRLKHRVPCVRSGTTRRRARSHARIVHLDTVTTTTIHRHRVTVIAAGVLQVRTQTLVRATAQRALQACTTTMQIHRHRATHAAPERTRQ